MIIYSHTKKDIDSEKTIGVNQIQSN